MPVGGFKASQKKKAEAARLAEEAAKAKEEEEARLAQELQAQLDASKNCEIDFDTPEGKLRDLMKWLNSIPLSKKCFNRIDREFSDGVLVAEIIEHYLPEICKAKHVFPFSSSENKRSNWDFLNRKVLPHLGFRLEGATICNLIQPWGCSKHDKRCPNSLLIFDVLYKLRKNLAKENEHVYDYRNEPDDDLSCSKSDKKPTKPLARPRNPDPIMYSKIELQIANGTYDDYRNQSYKSQENKMMENWVNIYLSNGTQSQIVFDDGACDYTPKCYIQQCCEVTPTNCSYPI